MFGEIFNFGGNSKKTKVVLNGKDLTQSSENIFVKLEKAVLRVENCLKNSECTKEVFDIRYSQLADLINNFSELGLDEVEKKGVLEFLYRFLEVVNHYQDLRFEKKLENENLKKKLGSSCQIVVDKLAHFKDLPIAA